MDFRLSFCLCHEFNLRKITLPNVDCAIMNKRDQIAIDAAAWEQKKKNRAVMKEGARFLSKGRQWDRMNELSNYSCYCIFRHVVAEAASHCRRLYEYWRGCVFHVRAFVFLQVCVSLSVEIPFVVFAVSGVTFASICCHFCCLLRIGYFFCRHLMSYSPFYCNMLSYILSGIHPFTSVAWKIKCGNTTATASMVCYGNPRRTKDRRFWCGTSCNTSKTTATSAFSSGAWTHLMTNCYH